MTAKTIDQLLDELIQREGGYTNHPADRGGPTKYGITQAVARNHGYEGDMRDLPLEEARRIYTRLYWLAPKFDQVALLSPAVAAELFDTGVNMGPSIASRFLQRALNALNRNGKDYPDTYVDGRLGPATLAMLAAFLKLRGTEGEKVLIRALEAQQGERYINLTESRPPNEAFLYGWLANRIGAL